MINFEKIIEVKIFRVSREGVDLYEEPPGVLVGKVVSYNHYKNYRIYKTYKFYEFIFSEIAVSIRRL